MRLGRGVMVGSLIVGSLLSAGPSLSAQGEPRFSIQCQDLPATEVSNLLSRELGRTAVYIPRDPESRTNLDLKNLSRADIEAALGKSGTFATAASLPGAPAAARVSLQASGAPLQNVAEALRLLSQDHFRVVPRDPRQIVSLDCKQVTYSQLAAILASFGEAVLHPQSE